MKTEHLEMFKRWEIGDKTNKGVIVDFFFLTFDGAVSAFRSNEPTGKGILMAELDNKKHCSIGELTKTEP